MNSSEALRFMGLNTDCSAKDIRNRYKIMAKKLHPDAGGTAEKMQNLNEAKEVLDVWVKSRSTSTGYSGSSGFTGQSSKGNSRTGASTSGNTKSTYSSTQSSKKNTKSNPTGDFDWADFENAYNRWDKGNPVTEDGARARGYTTNRESSYARYESSVNQSSRYNRNTSDDFDKRQPKEDVYRNQVNKGGNRDLRNTEHIKFMEAALNKVAGNVESSNYFSSNKPIKVIAGFFLVFSIITVLLCLVFLGDVLAALKLWSSLNGVIIFYFLCLFVALASIPATIKILRKPTKVEYKHKIFINYTCKIGSQSVTVKSSGSVISSFAILDERLFDRWEEIRESWKSLTNIGFIYGQMGTNVQSAFERLPIGNVDIGNTSKIFESNMTFIHLTIKDGNLYILPGLLICEIDGKYTVKELRNLSVSSVDSKVMFADTMESKTSGVSVSGFKSGKINNGKFIETRNGYKVNIANTRSTTMTDSTGWFLTIQCSIHKDQSSDIKV